MWKFALVKNIGMHRGLCLINIHIYVYNVLYVLTCGSLSGALIRTMHRPIRPVQRIHPTEFLMVRLHPISNVKNLSFKWQNGICNLQRNSYEYSTHIQNFGF